jgi:hypothetical protein
MIKKREKTKGKGKSYHNLALQCSPSKALY